MGHKHSSFRTLPSSLHIFTQLPFTPLFNDHFTGSPLVCFQDGVKQPTAADPTMPAPQSPEQRSVRPENTEEESQRDLALQRNREYRESGEKRCERKPACGS